MFTAFFLQDELVAEMERIFAGHQYPDRNGGMADMHVYRQYLPLADVRDTGDIQEELESGLPDDVSGEVPVPYIQVILPGGLTRTTDENGRAGILLYLCAYDESGERNGFQHILNMIQKIMERFEKNPMAGNYRCGDEIAWELSDYDDHPYYFGAVSMEFSVPAVRKEDRYC